MITGSKLAPKALGPLVQVEPDVDRLLACLKADSKPDHVITLYGRATRADRLPKLMGEVEYGTLSTMLGVERDTVVLDDLIARATVGTKGLAKLLELIPDRDQLERALGAGFKGDLPKLAADLGDTSRIGDLLELVSDQAMLLDLVQLDPSSARLMSLLAEWPKPSDLRALLQAAGKGRAALLLKLAPLEKDGQTLRAVFTLDDPYAAEALLRLVPDRAQFRSLVAKERRPDVLEKMLTKVPEPARVLEYLDVLSQGWRSRVDEFLAILSDHAQLLALLRLYGGAMSRDRLLKLTGVLSHDGVDGAGMVTLLSGLAGAMSETVLETAITSMRGNLSTAAAGPVATSITTPGGEKALLGTEIAAHAAHTTAMGRGLADMAGRYPTGQDPAARTDNELWTDCSLTAITHPDVTQATHQEDAGQKAIRQKMALKELMRRYPARSLLVQRIFGHDQGQTPRPFVSVANEDTYAAGAHTVDRHVLDGSGTIPDMDAVATRACLKQPFCGSTASAFTSLANANTAISTAITATVVANWAHYRDLIVSTGLIGAITHTCAAGLGVCMKKRDHPRSDPYAPGDMTGGRSLRAVGPGAANSLTFVVAVSQVEMSMEVTEHANAHGWSVYTSWPSP